MSRWTTDAWSAMRPDAALWYATKTPDFHREFAEVNEAIGLWNEQPEPPCTPEHECESLTLEAALLDRKIAALRAHGSQTRPLLKMMGPDLFRAWVKTEWFRVVTPDGQRPALL